MTNTIEKESLKYISSQADANVWVPDCFTAKKLASERKSNSRFQCLSSHTHQRISGNNNSATKCLLCITSLRSSRSQKKRGRTQTTELHDINPDWGCGDDGGLSWATTHCQVKSSAPRVPAANIICLHDVSSPINSRAVQRVSHISQSLHQKKHQKRRKKNLSHEPGLSSDLSANRAVLAVLLL